jgi:hypothetical protein
MQLHAELRFRQTKKAGHGFHHPAQEQASQEGHDTSVYYNPQL